MIRAPPSSDDNNSDDSSSDEESSDEENLNPMDKIFREAEAVNTQFQKRIAEYIEVDNAEALESLLKEKIHHCLKTYDPNKLDMLLHVQFGIHKLVVDPIYEYGYRYDEDNFENLLNLAARKNSVKCLKLLMLNLDNMYTTYNILKHKRIIFAKMALIVGIEQNSVEVFKIINRPMPGWDRSPHRLFFFSVSPEEKTPFEYAYMAETPQPEILAYFADFWISNDIDTENDQRKQMDKDVIITKSINDFATKRELLSAFDMFWSKVRDMRDNEEEKSRVKQYMERILNIAIEKGHPDIIAFLIRCYKHDDIGELVVSHSGIVDVCKREMFGTAKLLMPYTTTSGRASALYDFVYNKNIDGIQFLMSIEEDFPIDFAQKFHGLTIHQAALQFMMDEKPILDLLFKGRLCKNNKTEPTEGDCLIDGVTLDCLDPNDDILINSNAYNGQGWECQGSHMYHLDVDPFTRDPIQSKKVNDLVERLLHVYHDEKKIKRSEDA